MGFLHPPYGRIQLFIVIWTESNPTSHGMAGHCFLLGVLFQIPEKISGIDFFNCLCHNHLE